MRHLFAAIVAASAIVCAADTACAQQPPMHATGVAAPVSVGSLHDGGYIGVTAGLATSAFDVPDAGGLAANISRDGVFGGLYLGYGRVIDGIYVGVEVDGMLRDVTPKIGDGTTTITMSNRWVASGRARVGLPVGPVLFYGTGGVAMQESVLKISDPALTAKDTAMVYGLVGGVGVEAELTRTVSLRVEGLHFAWQDETFTIAGEQAKIGQSDTIIRVGLGFKLQ